MSKNQLALAEGRIDQDAFDSMAAYKYLRYGNSEDLDYDADYSDYGLGKVIPLIKYTPAAQDYPGVVAEIYQVFKHEIEEEDLREICQEWDGGSVFVSYSGRWYWCPIGYAGGECSYIRDILNEDLEYPGKLEVDSLSDAV